MAPRLVHAATFLVINDDGPNEGFNDPTAAAPVGGNPGTTVGAQRLIAFQFAANLWGARLSSPVTVRVGAEFNPLFCTATSAVLGSAGPNSVFRNFSGAPVINTWFVEALANSLAGVDQDVGSDDIGATFSSTIGTPGCLQSSGWYYGLDGNAPANRIDFVTVLLHEMGHGLGFLDLVDLGSGAKFLGFDDAYMRFLENHNTGEFYPTMTNAERVTASKNTGNLHWTGVNAIAEGASLTAGRHSPSGHIQMYAPNPQEPGSSVSHWDTALSPNQLMEPSYTGPLHSFELELALFEDLGWQTQPPTPCGDGVIDPGEECDDGNLLSGDGCSGSCVVEACYICTGAPSSCSLDASCGLNLKHFLFYKVKTTPKTPKFVPPPPVHLVDQFENKTHNVKKPLALGNPANKNGEDPGAVTYPHHLKAYLIKEVPGTPPHAKRSNIRVDNQFGTIFVDTIKAERLLVPTAKSHISQPPPPVDPPVDHFKCYKVKVTPGTPKFQARQASVVDQFNQPKTFDVKKPTRLCNPVDKNDEHIQQPDAHLMCYQVTPAAGQSKHNPVLGLFVNNQFGPERLDTIKEEELCLPSLKTD
jgi:cysteine-rich repeat protein